MEKRVSEHAEIMDKYDPDKRVGLIVDEWGTWFEVEPGTNPGFLYQQNTMRDAMVAAVTLDIFNKHCDRVFMANIAQTVNVLQAIILTEDGNKNLCLRPTPGLPVRRRAGHEGHHDGDPPGDPLLGGLRHHGPGEICGAGRRTVV